MEEKIRLLESLWEQHRKTNVTLRFPIMQEGADGRAVKSHAHALIQSLLPEVDSTHIPLDNAAGNFDYRVTMFTTMENGTPVQHHPFMVPEADIVSPLGCISENRELLKNLVVRFRKNLSDGIMPESSLLPVLTHEEIDILLDAGYYNGEISVSGQTISAEQKNATGRDPIEFMQGGMLGRESVRRFIAKLTTRQGHITAIRRRSIVPQGFMSSVREGRLVSQNDVETLMADIVGFEREEQIRLSRGLRQLVYGLDFELLSVMRRFPGATVEGYGFFHDNRPRIINTKEGKETIHPRAEIIRDYPFLVNMIGNDPMNRRAVDNGESVANIIRDTLSRSGDNVTKIGKKTLKALRGKRIESDQTPIRFMKVIGSIPANMIPEDTRSTNESVNNTPFMERTQWDDMEACMACMGELEKATGISVSDLASDVRKGNWSDYRMRLAKAASNKRIPQGMDEELYGRVMDILPVNKWQSMEDRDEVRIEIEVAVDELFDAGILGDGFSKGDIKAWLEAHNAPRDGFHEMKKMGRRCQDMVSMLSSKVILPVMSHESGVVDSYVTPALVMRGEEVARKILFSTPRSAVRVMSQLTWYQGNFNDFLLAGANMESGGRFRNSMMDIMGRDIERNLEMDAVRKRFGFQPDLEWTPLVSRSVTVDGYDFMPLINVSELRTEGDIMSHCVGGYGWRNRSGEVRIFSVSENGERVSTLELLPDLEEETVKSGQNNSYRNSMPPESCMKATRQFVDNINNGSIMCHWSEMRRELEEKMEESRKKKNERCQLSMVSHESGYTPSKGAIRDALKPWLEFMDRKTREFPVRTIKQAPGFIEGVRTINLNYDHEQEKGVGTKQDIEKDSEIRPAWIV